LEIPEQYGGSAAGDFRYNAVLCEELGKVSMSLGSCHGIHADIVAPYLVELTTEEQRALAAGLRVRRDPHRHRHDRGVRWL
jgi:long-chain-acyl-CoA dehydrogenase